MEGKEIDLKEWGLKKGVEYAKGILTIAIGSCPGIANTSALTNEIISVTCKYAAQKSAEILENQLIKKGGSILQEICSKCITEPLMKGIKSKYFSDNKYFVMDLVNDDTGFENFIVGKTINTFEYISKSVLIMGPIIKHIRIIIKERSLKSILKGLPKLKHIFKECFLLIRIIINNFNIETKFLERGKSKVSRFYGSLKTLIQNLLKLMIKMT